MVDEGRAEYADPSSMIRAGAMLLNHIGYPDRGKKLEMALDICGNLEKKLVITGRQTGAKGSQFADYIMETLRDPGLQAKWQSYQPEVGARA
jgi:isocitrate/isopropylmalate dehydrogenase